MTNALRYSSAVRARTIEAAAMLLEKAGCMVQVYTDSTTTQFIITNPPDHADRVGQLAKATVPQGDSHT